MQISSFRAPRAISPLTIAAYLTWATVGYALWSDSLRWPPWGPIPARALAAALMTLFLLAFVVLVAAPESPNKNALKVTTIAVMIGTALGLVAFGPQSATPVLLIVVASVLMASYPARTAWLILGIINVVFLAILWWRWRLAEPMFTFLIYAGFEIFSAVTSSALVRAESTADELRLTNAELLATRSLLAESARDGERLRVSRELHDVAGHKLTALSLNIDILRHDSSIAQRRELDLLRNLTSELLSDVRSVVARLRRDDGLDLREALRRVAEVFPKPRVHLEIGEDTRVADAERAEALLRIAQEALTNAARHANADNVWLSLKPGHDSLDLLVEDDGSFTGQYGAGYGLVGMRERIEQLGGTLETGRGVRGGFSVSARLPHGRP
jgi:signal transduction histidine kinase